MQDSFTPEERRRNAVRRGARAELRVEQVLSAAGWVVLARNWVGAGAELDIIVSRSGQLRFVEVKQRTGHDLSGLDSVGVEKQRRLVRAAKAWLAYTELEPEEMAFAARSGDARVLL